MLGRTIALAVAFVLGASAAFAAPVGPFQTLAIKFEGSQSSETLFVRKTADSRILFENCVGQSCNTLGRQSGYSFEEIQQLRTKNKIKSRLFKGLVHEPVSICASLLGAATAAAVPLVVGVGIASGASEMGAGLFSLVFAGAGYILAILAWLAGGTGSYAIVNDLITSSFSTENRWYGPSQLTASTEYLEAPQGFWSTMILPGADSPERFVDRMQWGTNQKDLFPNHRNTSDQVRVITVRGASDKVINQLEASLRSIGE